MNSRGNKVFRRGGTAGAGLTESGLEEDEKQEGIKGKPGGPEGFHNSMVR